MIINITRIRNKLNRVVIILSRIEAIEDVASGLKNKDLRMQLMEIADTVKEKEVEVLRKELKQLYNLIGSCF